MVETRGFRPQYMLASYYYIRDKSQHRWMLKHADESDWCDDLMLDSGAFTMFHDDDSWDSKTLEDYVDDYADCVLDYDIDHYFGMDIDVLVGLDHVLELRDRLESRVGRDCIPVWHKNRGHDRFVKMCGEYDYVAIGGLHREITRGDFDKLPLYTGIAHDRGAKIHGLGYTPWHVDRMYGFDSVDSGTWTGVRYGWKYDCDGPSITSERASDLARDMPMELLDHNLTEWMKYAKFVKQTTEPQP